MPEHIFDEQLGKAAFERMEAWLMSLEKDRIESVRLPLDGAAMEGLSLARKIAVDDVIIALGQLPEFAWSPASAERLEDVAWATWYIRNEAKKQLVQKSSRKVSLELVQEGTELRGRMLELTTYQLGDHPKAGLEIIAIRLGTGYLDLAMDLSRLAGFYSDPDYKATIASDSKNFREGDEAEARHLASAILEELGAGQKQRWAELEARSWTRLNADYNEVRRALNFIYHHSDPHNLRDVPTLFQALRAAPKSKVSDAPIVSGDGEPVPSS